MRNCSSYQNGCVYLRCSCYETSPLLRLIPVHHKSCRCKVPPTSWFANQPTTWTEGLPSLVTNAHVHFEQLKLYFFAFLSTKTRERDFTHIPPYLGTYLCILFVHLPLGENQVRHFTTFVVKTYVNTKSPSTPHWMVRKPPSYHHVVSVFCPFSCSLRFQGDGFCDHHLKGSVCVD